MKDKNRSLFSFNFVFAILLFAFAIIVFFYCFPNAGTQIDNKIMQIYEQIFSCKSVIKIFARLSEYSNFLINKAFYLFELVADNISGAYDEVKKVSPVIFASAATFPCDRTNITSYFGGRTNPVSYKKEVHSGIDIAGAEGENVYAAWPGQIIETGKDKIYGNYIVIEHSSGFTTKYCHLKKIIKKVGDYVMVKEAIGLIGSSGQSTGNHLHFEIKVDGRNVDPMECLEIC